MASLSDGLSHINMKVFVASGDMGRTIMSCDGGLTWTHDQSDDDTVRCGVVGDPNYKDCDNSSKAAQGLDAGDNWFFANYGWSQNGEIRRSQDGVHWTSLRSDGWGDGVAYSKGVLLLNWSTWFTSPDFGVSWSTVTSSSLNTLSHPKLTRSADLMFAMGTSTPALAVSADQGQTWSVPAGFKPEWTGQIAKGNNLIVSVGTLVVTGNPTLGYEAYSSDNGVIWHSQNLFTANVSWSGPIFDGNQFVAWANGIAWKSADGATWTQRPMVVNGTGAVSAVAMSGPVAFDSTTGTYVMIPSGQSYATQQAYRSADGVTWTLLDAAHFAGGHPIHDLVVGDMDSGHCQ